MFIENAKYSVNCYSITEKEISQKYPIGGEI